MCCFFIPPRVSARTTGVYLTEIVTVVRAADHVEVRAVARVSLQVVREAGATSRPAEIRQPPFTFQVRAPVERAVMIDVSLVLDSFFTEVIRTVNPGRTIVGFTRPFDAPTAFTATASTVYTTPFVRPVIVHVVVDTEQVRPPGESVTTYPVAVDTVVHDTVTARLPPATTIDTALGTDRSNEVDVVPPVPTPFVPLTVIVYIDPFVNPLIVHVDAVDEQDRPPGVAVAVYVTPGSAPVHVTTDERSPRVAETDRTVTGTTSVTDLEADGPAPTAFTPTTLIV